MCFNNGPLTPSLPPLPNNRHITFETCTLLWNHQNPQPRLAEVVSLSFWGVGVEGEAGDLTTDHAVSQRLSQLPSAELPDFSFCF